MKKKLLFMFFACMLGYTSYGASTINTEQINKDLIKKATMAANMVLECHKKIKCDIFPDIGIALQHTAVKQGKPLREIVNYAKKTVNSWESLYEVGVDVYPFIHNFPQLYSSQAQELDKKRIIRDSLLFASLVTIGREPIYLYSSGTVEATVLKMDFPLEALVVRSEILTQAPSSLFSQELQNRFILADSGWVFIPSDEKNLAVELVGKIKKQRSVNELNAIMNDFMRDMEVFVYSDSYEPFTRAILSATSGKNAFIKTIASITSNINTIYNHQDAFKQFSLYEKIGKLGRTDTNLYKGWMFFLALAQSTGKDILLLTENKDKAIRVTPGATVPDVQESRVPDNIFNVPQNQLRFMLTSNEVIPLLNGVKTVEHSIKLVKIIKRYRFYQNFLEQMNSFLDNELENDYLFLYFDLKTKRSFPPGYSNALRYMAYKWLLQSQQSKKGDAIYSLESLFPAFMILYDIESSDSQVSNWISLFFLLALHEKKKIYLDSTRGDDVIELEFQNEGSVVSRLIRRDDVIRSVNERKALYFQKGKKSLWGQWNIAKNSYKTLRDSDFFTDKNSNEGLALDTLFSLQDVTEAEEIIGRIDVSDEWKKQLAYVFKFRMPEGKGECRSYLVDYYDAFLEGLPANKTNVKVIKRQVFKRLFLELHPDKARNKNLPERDVEVRKIIFQKLQGSFNSCIDYLN